MKKTDYYNTDTTASGAVVFNFKRNSNFIIGSVFLLIVFGLISLYSASYYYAMEDGLPSYSYLFKQLIRVICGLCIGSAVLVASRKLLEILCPVLTLAGVVVFVVGGFSKLNINIDETAVNIIFLIHTMYLALFFANREGGIKKLRELTLPIIFSLLFFLLIIINGHFSLGFVFIVLTVIMFACGSVGFAGVVLLLFYIAVPLVVWILSNPTMLKRIINIFIPNYYPSVSAEIVSETKAAVISGSLFGKGLGNGSYKYGAVPGIFRENIFCNVAEEFGFAGVFVVCILFGVLLYCSFRSANHLREKDRFYSNFSCGLAFVIFSSFVLNIVSVLGILPVSGISMPFFSYSNVIVVTITIGALLYKMSKDNDVDFEVENEREYNSDSDFEVKYES